MNPYQILARPLLFRLDPERVHRLVIWAAAWLGTKPDLSRRIDSALRVEDPRLVMNVGGVTFPNPIGLAAGFDKNGRAICGLGAAGFGSIEIGSVSVDPSEGNPRPRLFRIPADEAIIVNYGVPNEGAKRVAKRIGTAPRAVPLGVNLVETNRGRVEPPDRVLDELVSAAHLFADRCDYLVLNLNCPNTDAGRSLFDDPLRLRELLEELCAVSTLPPIFLKVSAALGRASIDAVIAASAPHPPIKGFMLNAPAGKPFGLKTSRRITDAMPGTVCGAPLRELIDVKTRIWYRSIDSDRHRLVAPGGLRSAEDVYRRIRLGASLVQVYTALIYEGPTLIRDLNRGLLRLMDRDGVKHLSEIVGIDAQ